MYNTYFESLISLEDFNNAQTGLTYTTGELTDRTFTYNNLTKSVRVRKPQDTSGTFFKMFFRNMLVGEILEFSCMVRTVNGLPFRVSVEEHNSTKAWYISKGTNEWEYFTFTHVLTQNINDDTSSKLSIGLMGSMYGEFELKNVCLKKHTKVNKTLSVTTPKRQMYSAVMVKNPSSNDFEFRDDFTRDSNLSYTKVDNTTFKITVNSGVNTRPCVLLGNHGWAESRKYTIRPLDVQKTTFTFGIFNSSGVQVDITAISAEQIWLPIVIIYNYEENINVTKF